MILEAYIIGAYWSARPETPSACAERMLQLMTELASCHELMAGWNQPGRSLRDALRKKINPTRQALEPLFTVICPDDPVELGYSFDCWNGRKQDEEQVGLSTSCGSAPSVSGVPNNLVLNLPRPSDIVASLYEPNILLRVLRAIVDAWMPDWATLMSCAYRDQYISPDGTPPPDGKPDVGWMTYLRQKRLTGLSPTDSPPCEAVPIPNRGTIFVLTREHRFSVSNPGDIARAKELTEWLEARGALIPIPSNEPF